MLALTSDDNPFLRWTVFDPRVSKANQAKDNGAQTQAK